MRLVLVAIALCLASRSAAGQTSDRQLSFEVASVKPASAAIATVDEYSAGYNAGMRSALASFGMRITGLRVNITDNSLKDLIRLAYEVRDYQIAAPAWMANEKYEIVANMPAGSTSNEAPAMLRSLLADRFHLELHRESKTTAVYALLAGKDGVKLTPADKGGHGPASAWTEGGVSRLNVTGNLAAFADLLTKVADRPVIDATGVPGAFAFDVAYAAQLTESDSTPSLTTALRAMGLRLEKRETPLEILVIDRAEKIPSGN